MKINGSERKFMEKGKKNLRELRFFVNFCNNGLSYFSLTLANLKKKGFYYEDLNINSL